MGAGEKSLEICHSRLLENAFARTETAKNVSKKFISSDRNFDKSHDEVLKLRESWKQTQLMWSLVAPA